MADYYPLVAKAVAGLEKNTGEGRRLLYERARTALVAQLRGMNDPPLTEAEITRERLALEEAIRKVEAEAARRGRDAPRPEAPAPTAPAAPKADAEAPSRAATEASTRCCARSSRRTAAAAHAEPQRHRRGTERFPRCDRRGGSARRCDRARRKDRARSVRRDPADRRRPISIASNPGLNRKACARRRVRHPGQPSRLHAANRRGPSRRHGPPHRVRSTRRPSRRRTGRPSRSASSRARGSSVRARCGSPPPTTSKTCRAARAPD